MYISTIYMCSYSFPKGQKKIVVDKKRQNMSHKKLYFYQQIFSFYTAQMIRLFFMERLCIM
jgi:hypothetical protein